MRLPIHVVILANLCQYKGPESVKKMYFTYLVWRFMIIAPHELCLSCLASKSADLLEEYECRCLIEGG